jgi:hypothetical protein
MTAKKRQPEDRFCRLSTISTANRGAVFAGMARSYRVFSQEWAMPAKTARDFSETMIKANMPGNFQFHKKTKSRGVSLGTLFLNRTISNRAGKNRLD